MSPPEAPQPDDEAASREFKPRRVTLDVTLKRDARTGAPTSAPWTTERSWVLAFFLLFCGASWYAWVELRGHPIATYVSALPQLTAVFAATTTLLGGGDPTLAKNWYQSRASTLLRAIDRRARRVCAGLALAALLLGYAGASMQDIDVECPAGCQLAYGHLGAQTACDQHHDRVWMPLGLAEVAPTFECSMTGGHGEWPPLRRTVRDDEGTHETFSCYEDGGRVISHAPTATLEYIEYGWGESSPARTPAPCDHLPVGLYSYDPAANTCTWLMSMDALTQAFRDAIAPGASDAATRDALLRLIGSACHDCPTDTDDDGDADATDAGVPVEAGATPAPSPAPAPSPHTPTTARWGHARAHDTSKPDTCARPDVEPFSFFAPDGCHGQYGDVVLELVAREVAIPVGISYRGGSDRRCVPSERRRDGYIHLLLPDGELVLGVTRGETPARVVLVEDVRTTVPPPALATTCTD